MGQHKTPGRQHSKAKPINQPLPTAHIPDSSLMYRNLLVEGQKTLDPEFCPHTKQRSATARGGAGNSYIEDPPQTQRRVWLSLCGEAEH